MKSARRFAAVVLAAAVLAPAPAHARLVLDGGSEVVKKLHDGAAERQKPAKKKKRAGQRFAWPVKGNITTYFTGDHSGIDIDGEAGDPIFAARPGEVTFAGDDGDGYGVKVVIRHAGGYETLYSHLSSVAVSQGPIARGDLVGKMGCTGSCTGDHLHFEILRGGTVIDPLPLLP